MNALAMQVAFILPLMIALGAHYLPFIFFYMVYGSSAPWPPSDRRGGCPGPVSEFIFSLGGWFTGLALLVFAFLGRWVVLKVEGRSR